MSGNEARPNSLKGGLVFYIKIKDIVGLPNEATAEDVVVLVVL